jgi:hypothetical protein
MEYLKNQLVISKSQIQGSNDTRSALSKIVVRLWDDDKSKDTDAAVEELKRKIQDWKGIDPYNLGELILSKTLYVVKSSKTKLVSGIGMWFSIMSDSTNTGLTRAS